MTERPAATDLDAPRHTSRGVWVFAAAVAVALHVGCAALALASLNDTDADDELGSPGLAIDLDLAAPRSEPNELPPGPDSDASAASAAQVEQKQVQKEEDLPKEMPQQVEDPDQLVTQAEPKKPDEKQPDTPAQQATPSTEAAASEATAMPSSETAQQSDKSTTPAQGVGEAKQRVRTTWQKELVAHLDRHKRYPADRSQRAAEIQVAFTIDRTGHLLSSSIVKSSGDPSFDAAALSMLARSDPLPPPPPLIADDGLSFTVPVIFRVKNHG
jgi:periplasmic protein TonB